MLQHLRWYWWRWKAYQQQRSERQVRSRLSHEVHVLINKRQNARPDRALHNWEHWLYEAKQAGEERRRVPHLFARARTGTLATVFQYCSFSPPEPIADNHLRCALGLDVATCPILADVLVPLRGQFPAHLLDDMQADICVGHILWRSAEDGHMVHDNTGYITTADDRMYWDRLHANLAGMDDGDDTQEEPTPCPHP